MTESHSANGADETDPVGSIIEEAAKLMKALAFDRFGGSAETSESQSEGSDESVGDHECPNSWCPVCRMTAFVREHPEALDHVLSSAGELMRSVSELIGAARAHQPDSDEEPAS